MLNQQDIQAQPLSPERTQPQSGFGTEQPTEGNKSRVNLYAYFPALAPALPVYLKPTAG